MQNTKCANPEKKKTIQKYLFTPLQYTLSLLSNDDILQKSSIWRNDNKYQYSFDFIWEISIGGFGKEVTWGWV
jgi:hypothetical protein